MAPTSDEGSLRADEHGCNKQNAERVVISGMSGLYPQSRSVKDLANILYSKTNPVTAAKPRWEYNHPEVAQYVGMLPGLERFDSQFFKVHYRLSNNMDSMGRKILEQAYQAIYDAGVSPEHLFGRKVGVFIGSCFSETEKASFYVASSRTGFGISGCSKTMFANRISYWLNTKGPSQSFDAACCSSTVALEEAYRAISSGVCESAIVGGANICLHPQSSIHYGRIITLCKDGKTKSFAGNADGCARSEAINVLFLQKAKDALRIYADVIHVKNQYVSLIKDETGSPKFGFYRNPVGMSDFLKEFYDEAQISPKIVEFVEGFGSADLESDKVELEAFDKIFCSHRKEPLLVGSVTSNLGYGEAASGISAVTKVLIGYHRGELAGNLHCEIPRQDVDALKKGRMRIISDHQPFLRTYTAINGLSISGLNSHILLHGHYNPKDPLRYQCSFPRLVTISGRHDSAVKTIIEDLKSRVIDPEEIALIHNIHSKKITGHMGRGFTILDTDNDSKTISLSEKVDYFDDSSRPLWFVYSGMGSQWSGMGAALMRIPIFADAIERCRKVLEPKGIDIVHVISTPDKTIYDNILHCFVGIAAVQIGLTDIMRALGIVPDKIIGHSVGELGCAYADGCLTAEEMILAAYCRGLVSIQTPFIRGSMAAVGIGYQQVLHMCPPEIEVACHNGPDSSTISGPADAMRDFVAQLTAKGIFAKEVPCSNIAYHSRYIAEAGPGLLKYLKEIIKTPKLRSGRWVSTSVPQEKWNEPTARYSSAEYHTNNLLSPVLFEETSRLVPPQAVLVEIAPHGLLQAILKRSLPPSCSHVPLTRRGHPDNVVHLLEAIGKLYMESYNPNIQALYPKIEFPVSTGTPFLSHLVEWVHDTKWTLPLFVTASRKVAAACKFIISVHDSEHSYLKGQIIRGKMVFPLAGVLVAVWDTLAMSLGVTRRQLSVQFRDITAPAQPILQLGRSLCLSVQLHRGTGKFEVMDGISLVATGHIIGETTDISRGFIHSEVADDNVMKLKSDDVYQILKGRDYSYSNDFRSILEVNSSLTAAHILWRDNWVTLIDGMLQLYVLRQSHDGVSHPIHIRKLCIDLKKHLNNNILTIDGKTVMKATISKTHDYISCAGVLVEDIKFRNISPENKSVSLGVLTFVPRFQAVDNLNVSHVLQVFMQIVEENISKNKINVVKIINKPNEDTLFTNIKNILKNIHDVEIKFHHMNKNNVIEDLLKNSDVVFVQDLSTDDNICQTLYRLLRRDTFIINADILTEDMDLVRPSTLYSVVSAYNGVNTRIELVRWRPKPSSGPTSAFSVRTHSDLALLQTARANLLPHQSLIVIASYPPLPGLKSMVKQWRSEPKCNEIYLLMSNHKISEKQILDQLPDLNLAFNVLDHGVWGGEYYVPYQEMVPSNQNITLKSGQIGVIDSLYWTERTDYSDQGINVKVHYAALNTCDVKRSLGKLPLENNSRESCFGMDFSGVTESGLRVMGMMRGGAVSDCVKADPALLWPVPEHWSLEDAATVPLPYIYAFYCIGINCYCARGSRILVHGGAGALGQAVISVALAFHCEVFTTVSNMAKKRFLLKLFPDLKEDNIGCSRDPSFGDALLTATGGEGCDIVICCVKGEMKNMSFNCCKGTGFVLDVDRMEIRENYILGMNYLTNDKHYMRLDISSIFETQNKEEIKMLQNMVSEGIARGYVRPLTRVTYSPCDAPRAFRLLAASRHRGRVLLRMHNTCIPAITKLMCSPENCHLIICNGTLGLNLADMLVKRGAKRIYLQLLKTSPIMDEIVKVWERLGVAVHISTKDISSSKLVANLLNEIMISHPLEGIHVMFSRTSDNVTQRAYHSLLANLDAATRKFCPQLKYFTVLGTHNDTIGRHICLSRAQDRLSATMLHLPGLLDVSSDTNTLNLTDREIVNLMERSLLSRQPIVQACFQSSDNISFLEQISNIVDIKIPEVDKSATLKELGIDANRARILSVFLLDTYNIAVSEERIPTLTIEKLFETEESLKEINLAPAHGLNTFFSYVDPDELQATAEMILLPTLTHSSTMRDDEFDISKTFLCIIPGMEGHYHRFRAMCESLKLPAFVLQPGLDRPNETVHDVAQRYAKILLKRTEIKNNFYLLGYEYGVIIALEIASILENNGLAGTIFLLGGGPEDFLEEVKAQMSMICEADTEEALQHAVAKHMVSLMGATPAELDSALRHATGWQEKVEASVRMIRGVVTHSAQYARALIDTAYRRVAQAQRLAISNVSAPRALRSRLVILRSPATTFTCLKRYSQQPVVVEDLTAPLSRATEDLKVPAYINKHLDEDLLQTFEKKNLCETYLLNADVFMSHVTLPES